MQGNVVHQVSGGKVVTTINHNVVSRHYFQGVVGPKTLPMRNYFHVRVESEQGFAGRIDLGHANSIHVVQNLPLEVRGVNNIVVHDPDSPDTGCSQIESSWRAETPRSDEQNPCTQKPQLSRLTDLGKPNMSCVSRTLVSRQATRIAPGLPVHFPSIESAS
jgi:hypothetical protein